MKTFLILTAALGLSTSVAMADCAGHSKVTASVDVDRELKTASISTPQSQAQQVLLLKKEQASDKAEATD